MRMRTGPLLLLVVKVRPEGSVQNLADKRPFSSDQD